MWWNFRRWAMGEGNNKEIITPSKATISEHIKHIFEERELDEKAVVRKFRTTASDGKKRCIA